MARVRSRNLGEVGKLSPIQLNTLFYQFPTDSRNHLLPPGVEQAWKSHPSRSRRSAQLEVSLDQKSLGTRPTRLDRSDYSCRSSANHKHVDIIRNLRLNDCLVAFGHHDG